MKAFEVLTWVDWALMTAAVVLLLVLGNWMHWDGDDDFKN